MTSLRGDVDASRREPRGPGPERRPAQRTGGQAPVGSSRHPSGTAAVGDLVGLIGHTAQFGATLRAGLAGAVVHEKRSPSLAADRAPVRVRSSTSASSITSGRREELETLGGAQRPQEENGENRARLRASSA